MDRRPIACFWSPGSPSFRSRSDRTAKLGFKKQNKRTSIRFRRKRPGCDLGSGCPPVSRGNSPCRRLHETLRGASSPHPPRLRPGGGAPIGSTNGARADLSHPPPIYPDKFDIGDHASKSRRLPITRAALPSRPFQARRDQAARDPQTKYRGEPRRQTCGPVTEMSHLTYKIPTISSEEANRD